MKVDCLHTNPVHLSEGRDVRQFFSAAVLLVLTVKPAAAGTIDTVAGTGKAGFGGDGGKATAATLNQPFHCDLNGKGNLYVAEANNHRIRRIDLKTGVITTVAGNGTRG